MYGDKLKQAIDTINEYLQQGNNIELWDANDPEKTTLTLGEDSELDFIVWELDWEGEK